MKRKCGKYGVIASACAMVCCSAAQFGCGRAGKPVPPGPTGPPAVKFTDVTEDVGIRFRHVTGASGKTYLPETMGSGCAFLDYDNDDRLDVLLVNGDFWSPRSGQKRPTLTLYRNEGTRFSDVTLETGLSEPMYGMGVAVGDFDNDGYDDIFVTGVGRCRLYHNVEKVGSRKSARGSQMHVSGSGTIPLQRRGFRDVTAQAGVASPGWSTSATWTDYDRDGLLDLFVCHYVQWSMASDKYFSIDGSRKTYSTPQQYPGETCRLYRNLGRGKFADVTQQAGIYSDKSKALGVVVLDFDLDGWPDIAVANDTEQNFLFHNETNGKFREVALETGIAVGETARAKAGMGIDAADEGNRGAESIVITNFAGEQVTIYRPDGSGRFLDAAASSGLGAATQLYLGFGVFFFDYDGDGWQDLLVFNGHIQEDALVRQTGVQYREPALLLRNVAGTYSDVTTSTGTALQRPEVGRGAAWGDYDNDGRPDALLSSNGGPARLLRNVNQTNNHWLRIKLVGTRSNRNAIGALVRVKVGSRTLSQTVKGASSYLSQSDRRLLFGLGADTNADEIQIQWPNGAVQTMGRTAADQSLTITEP